MIGLVERADADGEKTLFDPRAAWAALSPAQQRRIGEAAILLGYTGLAGPSVEGLAAVAFDAGHYHAIEALDEAVAAVLLPLPAPLPQVGLGFLGLRQCRRCGCTDAIGCPEGCTWVADDLCSACARSIRG